LDRRIDTVSIAHHDFKVLIHDVVDAHLDFGIKVLDVHRTSDENSLVFIHDLQVNAAT
jgi:hypothetical protein